MPVAVEIFRKAFGLIATVRKDDDTFRLIMLNDVEQQLKLPAKSWVDGLMLWMQG